MYDNKTDGVFFESDIMFKKDKHYKAFELKGPEDTSGETLHAHDYMQIWFVTHGVVEHWIEGKKYRMIKGDSFILPPYISHKTILQKDASIICCEFALETFQLRGDESLGDLKDTLLDLSFMNFFFAGKEKLKPKFTVNPASQQLVERLMKSILTEYETEALYSKQFIQLHILEILLIYARAYRDHPDHRETTQIYGRYRSTIEQTIRFVNENYQKPISLDDMCRVSMISRTYFCYLFKMLTGRTFVNYLCKVRIEHATALLETTDKPITELCYEVGFNDLTHFSRTFKKAVGVSAREYRLLKRHACGGEDDDSSALL